MLFNSYIFVLCFLPVTLAGYFLLNGIKRYDAAKGWLLALSLLFYGYFNVKYLYIIICSIILNYLISAGLRKNETVWVKRFLLSAGLVFNLGLLFYYKYMAFFVANINEIFHVDYIAVKLLLPLGISFFTFQQLSFLIDGFHERVPTYSFLDYALFVSFFPQLIAGPIVTHDEIIPQFQDEALKKIDYYNLSAGLTTFTLGLAKKVLLADTFGEAVTWGYANIKGLDSTNAIIVIAAFTFQIYLDFSGYCDMASGIALMFNIKIPKNFDSPYKACTIGGFWKTWHMTLTRFFTKYVYIPMGGSWYGKLKTYRNVLITFLVSGLWHGANWTFVLWGGLHGLALVFDRVFSKVINRIHKLIRWFLTFIFVCVTWVYFRADSIGQANLLLKKVVECNFGAVDSKLYGCFGLTEVNFMLRVLRSNIAVIYPYIHMITFFLVTVFIIFFTGNVQDKIKKFRPNVITSLYTTILFIWCVLSFSGVSEFLYFNF